MVSATYWWCSIVKLGKGLFWDATVVPGTAKNMHITSPHLRWTVVDHQKRVAPPLYIMICQPAVIKHHRNTCCIMLPCMNEPQLSTEPIWPNQHLQLSRTSARHFPPLWPPKSSNRPELRAVRLPPARALGGKANTDLRKETPPERKSAWLPIRLKMTWGR